MKVSISASGQGASRSVMTKPLPQYGRWPNAPLTSVGSATNKEGQTGVTLATSEHEQEQKPAAKTPPAPGDALAPDVSPSLGISMCLAEMIRSGRARKQATFPRIFDPGKEFHCGNIKNTT